MWSSCAVLLDHALDGALAGRAEALGLQREHDAAYFRTENASRVAVRAFEKSEFAFWSVLCEQRGLPAHFLRHELFDGCLTGATGPEGLVTLYVAGEIPFVF